ncbi:MAG: AraC family transcriptional regulator [Pseudomonadota bacterium]
MADGGGAQADGNAAVPGAITLQRPPHPALAGLVTRIAACVDLPGGQVFPVAPAGLSCPLIISHGAPFRVALGTRAADRQLSFATGLVAAPVHVATTGPVDCIQADLTPLGAARLFGGAMPDLSGVMVALWDIWPGEAARLADRLWSLPDPASRIALTERFLAARFAHAPAASPAIAVAWHALSGSGGSLSVARLADQIGWSRTRLARRFRQEIGVPPKTAARLLRFARAMALGRTGLGWAEIAADAGFADQPHLVREFTALAGQTPAAWRAATAAPAA